MSELSQADQYMLDQIRQQNADAWGELVERYQGRLLAFARSQLRSRHDAEDLVQETMIAFLQGLDRFRGDASLETYLFTILRRRIIDQLRAKGRGLSVTSLEAAEAGQRDSASSSSPAMAADDPTVSSHARLDEERAMHRQVVATALRGLLEGYKQDLNFRDLRIVEMLFYCQLRNIRIAELEQVSQQQVALIKHRSLARLRSSVEVELKSLGRSVAAIDPAVWQDDALAATMIKSIWDDYRVSCPKRNTLGGFLLDTLEDNWRTYADFHLNQLGCTFCQANLDDLKRQTEAADAAPLRDRIMKSTVGFLVR